MLSALFEISLEAFTLPVGTIREAQGFSKHAVLPSGIGGVEQRRDFGCLAPCRAPPVASNPSAATGRSSAGGGLRRPTVIATRSGCTLRCGLTPQITESFLGRKPRSVKECYTS
jgi:hypothetical protein